MTDRHHSLRMPPDSTGKRLAHDAEVVVAYNNGVSAFTTFDSVEFETSTVSGVITEIEGTVSSGHIHVHLDEGIYEVSVSILNGENIQVGGVTYATVNGTPTETYYYGNTQLISGHNPKYHATIDRYGGLQIKAEQGNFQLGPTGRLRTTGEIILGSYDFEKYTLMQVISTEVTGAGTQTIDSTYGANKYSVSANAGDSIHRRTDVYHLTQPNYPVVFSTLLQCGDEGKDGLIRRWGLFDDDNGFFYELRDDILYAVMRSNNTGIVTEIRIPQSEWNADRLTGEGGEFNKTEAILDVSKSNYYFIGFSASSCSVQFGMRMTSRNITCHAYCWANEQTRPIVKNFDLPISWEMDTTAVVASTSEMYVVFGSVVAETPVFDVARNPRSFPIENRAVTGNWTPVASVRPRQTDDYGNDNRAWIVPNNLNILSITEPIVFRVKVGNTLEGETWTAGQTTLSEYDTDATASIGGIIIYSGFAGSGQAKVDEITSPGDLTAQTTKLTRKAVITATPFHFTLEAKSVSGGLTAIWVSVVNFEVI